MTRPALIGRYAVAALLLLPCCAGAEGDLLTPRPGDGGDADAAIGCLVEGYLGSACLDEASLVDRAVAACALRGWALGPYVFPNPCGAGAYQAVRYLCCAAPRLEGCIDERQEGRADCLDLDGWAAESRAHCAMFGLVPRSKPLLYDACGAMLFHSARFLCCPPD